MLIEATHLCQNIPQGLEIFPILVFYDDFYIKLGQKSDEIVRKELIVSIFRFNHKDYPLKAFYSKFHLHILELFTKYHILP